MNALLSDVTQAAASKVATSLHGLTAHNASSAKPLAATTTQPNAGTISSNDFLTLLVTEMKNQDPTQPTDPNAYIQQLTEVNSLQQLIAINQELAPAKP